MSKTVVITGAAGRIAYSLIPLVCMGHCLGPNTRIRLHLLDVMAEDKLRGVAMEIEDCCYPLVDVVLTTLSPEEAFRGVDVAILLGGYPRLPGMERKDLIHRNAEGMMAQAQALERWASRDVKVLVVANPANTNCLVAIKSAPSIPASNFSCLTRLDEERLRGMVASKASAVLMARGDAPIRPEHVVDVCIWGNHSSNQVPYIDSGRIVRADGAHVASLSSLFAASPPAEMQDLMMAVQTRGAAVIDKQKASSGLSAAAAVAAHLTDWLGPNQPEKIFSMGVLSNGNTYAIPADLVYSFPMRRTSSGDGVEMVRDLPVSPSVRAMLDASTDELLGEIRDAASLEHMGELFVSALQPKPTST